MIRDWAMRVALASLLAGGSVGAQQQPTPTTTDQPQATFRADVNYVEVDVHVTDERGNPVKGLTRDDFTVFENGARQPIGVFSAIEGRVEPAPPFLAPEPDVRSNLRPFTGRLYVLVLDDIHTAVARSPIVRSTVRRFIEQHIGANDLAAIVCTERSPRGQPGSHEQQASAAGGRRQISGSPTQIGHARAKGSVSERAGREKSRDAVCREGSARC